jgi:hypothetical protein
MLTPIDVSRTRIAAAGAGPARGSAGSARFRVDATTPTPNSVEMATAGEIATAEATGAVMLPFAEDDTAERDRRGHAHGLALLDALDDARAGLVGAADHGAVAATLIGMAASMPSVTDPRLAALLGLVTLRARIEAWRLGGTPDRADRGYEGEVTDRPARWPNR